MARPNANVSSFTPPSGFPPTAGFAIAVAILYFGRELVIPLAFALLISFLLSPAVKRLERWRVPRMPASLLVVALASAAVTIIGWLVMGELIQTARSLPQYTDNVRRKVQALEGQSRSVNWAATRKRPLRRRCPRRPAPRSGDCAGNPNPLRSRRLRRPPLRS